MASSAGALSHLRRLLESNRLFLDVAQEVNVSIVNTFLGVALWGEDSRPDDPVSLQELAERVGLSETTVSRHIRYLGLRRRVGVEGLGLVDTKFHPLDRRRRVVFLTRQGKVLRDRLLNTMSLDVSTDDSPTETRSMAG